MQLDWEIVVTYCIEKLVVVGALLAAMRCLLDGNIVFFEECPYQIRHLLVSDAMRITDPRLIPL
jgi:hypothetical protein